MYSSIEEKNIEKLSSNESDIPPEGSTLRGTWIGFCMVEIESTWITCLLIVTWAHSILFVGTGCSKHTSMLSLDEFPSEENIM